MPPAEAHAPHSRPGALPAALGWPGPVLGRVRVLGWGQRAGMGPSARESALWGWERLRTRSQGVGLPCLYLRCAWWGTGVLTKVTQ